MGFWRQLNRLANMVIFLTLITKLIPLYGLILFGFLSGKLLNVQKESISSLLIYIISPVVFFNAAATTPITPENISFPIICFCIILIMTLISYGIGRRFWHDGTENIFGYVSASGNIGYFGLPVALAVLPQSLIGIYILAVLGMNVFDVSGSYFLVARGKHTSIESLKRVLTLPTLYTFFLGIAVQLLHIPLGKMYADLITNFRGSYVILGMMLVGLGLSSISGNDLSFSFRRRLVSGSDILFMGLTFLIKFLLWPIVALGLIFLDTSFFHLYPKGVHNVLILLSIVPTAANSVAYSTQFHLHPQKTALVVLLTTLFAMFYVPFAVALLIK